MIFFIATAAYFKPLIVLVKTMERPSPACTIISYDELFDARRLGAGTYVFTDIERLSNQELLLASAYFRAMKAAAGFRVLNDPAKVKTRYALLRSLFVDGLNDFDAYRADGCPRPKRFPVFLRAESTHDAADTSLLADQAALDDRLAAFPLAGEPLRGLLVIEYSAEPFEGALFRRWAAFCIGGRIHLDNVVTEESWNVKYGLPGLVSEETYAEDTVAIHENRHAEVLSRAFAIAGIDYGRADFGIVNGRVQIYEINTNPTIMSLLDHASPSRRQAIEIARQRFVDNLQAIDTNGSRSTVSVDPQAFGRRFSRSQMEQARRKNHIIAIARTGWLRRLRSLLGRGGSDLLPRPLPSPASRSIAEMRRLMTRLGFIR